MSAQCHFCHNPLPAKSTKVKKALKLGIPLVCERCLIEHIIKPSEDNGERKENE